MSSRSLAASAAVGAVAACAALTPTAIASSERKPTVEVITFGTTTCAPHWYAPNPGRAKFRVENQSPRPAAVYLINAISESIVGQIPHLEAHASRLLTVTVKPTKSYQWACDLIGGTKHSSEPVTVPRDSTVGGPGRQVPPIQATTVDPALRQYRRYVAQQISALATEVAVLSQDVAGGDVATAEADWLDARETWLRIGQDDGAYSAFGSLGSKIDGTAAGLPDGTNDPDFTGFHKIELDLWGTGDMTAAATDVSTLSSYVEKLASRSLTKAMPGNNVGVANWILRCHEVIEDMVRDTLSGDDDYGSGEELAAVVADVQAAREILGLLAQFITPRAPHLVARAGTDLSRLSALASAGDHDGVWTPLAKLSRPQRERLDAAADAAAEVLARVPDLLRIAGT